MYSKKIDKNTFYLLERDQFPKLKDDQFEIFRQTPFDFSFCLTNHRECYTIT